MSRQLACPACGDATGEPTGFAPRCYVCDTSFRSPLMAMFLSMALPGWGHWYLRRRAIAAVELAVGCFLLCAAVLNLAFVFVRVLEGAPLLDLLRACLPWAVILVAYSVADGFFTWLVSRRHLVIAPTEKTP